MIRRAIPSFAALLLLAPAAAPASQKPCRDASGRVVACPKPEKPAPARCKDEKGRFITCKTAAKPTDAAPPSHNPNPR